MINGKILLDAKGSVLGRLASFAAKQALQGNEVTIINCKDVLVTGKRNTIFAEFKEARARGGKIQRGPFFPTVCERIVKRIVRGMLPYKNLRGADAIDRVKCYNGVPKEFEGVKPFESKMFAASEKSTAMTRLEEVAKQL